jgi:hypothetical protein
MRSVTLPSQISDPSSTVPNKSTKPVSDNFGESVNNRTLAANHTQINQHHKSLAQVR